MNLFYEENIEDKKIIIFSKEESNHCVKVRRVKMNDIISITDGKGNLYKARIIDNNFKKCSAEILEKKYFENQKKYKLHIAIAPTKSIDRFEWFVEKAVEIGVDEITPIICRYSERKVLKPPRIEKIIVSAMKQSLKYHKPILNPIIDFKNFVKTTHKAQKFIAFCKSDKTFSNSILQKEILFLIGPEGGFANFEFDLAIENDYNPLKINEFRLRTETAGIFVSSAVNINFQNKFGINN